MDNIKTHKMNTPLLSMQLNNQFFFLNFFIVVQYSCLHFAPTTPPNPSDPHLPPWIPAPFGFACVSFIHVPENKIPPNRMFLYLRGSRYPKLSVDHSFTLLLESVVYMGITT